MNNSLRTLLDRIYELEGLVHLAMQREDVARDFIRLISDKGNDVAAMCNALSEASGSGSSTGTPQYDSGMTAPLPDLQLEEYEIIEDRDSDPGREAASVAKDDKGGLQPAVSEAKNGKLVFSINERFRFKKELFSNSDVDFNNTLALVASMDNYEEAEEYFLNEEGFDIANPLVREFLEVLKRYFK